MIKRIISVCMGLASMVCAHAQTGRTFDLFVGTYTNTAKSNGIHIYSFDPNSGKLTHRSTTTGIQNPSYLTVSADNGRLYAVSEVGRGQARIHAFSYSGSSGRLDSMNSAPAGGDGPCYISTDRSGNHVFAAMYSAGSVSATALNSDGSLASRSQVIKYEGSSINKQNQSRPHAHSSILSPDGKYLLVADLGTDKIHTYRYDPDRAEALYDHREFTVKAGTGPRHLAFHPNGKDLYAVMELSAEVALLKYKSGELSVKQYITMLPEGFRGEVEAADVHVSPDGKFLYASNRADGNDLVIYSIARNGSLTFAGRQSEHIKTPRGFVIDPTGKFVLVANMDGNNVVVFRRDEKTGLLNYTGTSIAVDRPVCLKFSN